MSRNVSESVFADSYDVVICGAGLAGLALARHLRQHHPERSVLLLDRATRPLPDTTLKVGESTTEPGAHYLSSVLDLPGYFERNHIQKAGFRFFFGGPKGTLQNRPEFGIGQLPTIPSFNIERGRLENDLRDLNSSNGITLIEGVGVQEIILADNSADRHTVIVGDKTGERVAIRARWVVDAMGRRRFLQKQLGLTKPQLCRGSAVWFRLPARIDVTSLVPEAADEWHRRVPESVRYASTSHLMGKGYWVWLIPLKSGATSIGIVTLEEIHPFTEFNTFNKAVSWLRKREPQLAEAIGGVEPLDFKCMRRYSYSSRQLFSSLRWACIGDAGIFPDPLYAPGMDFIALGNLISIELIQQDFAGTLEPAAVAGYNQMILALNETMTQNIQSSYLFFDQPTVMSAKVLWDTAAGWGLFAPLIYNPRSFTDMTLNAELRRIKRGYYILSRRMQQLFNEWAEKAPGRCAFAFINFLSLPFLLELRDRNLRPGKDYAELVEDQKKNMEIFEELAQALFILAVQDVLPEQLERVLAAEWINAWRISLNSCDWDKDGLFRPRTEPRTNQLIGQIRVLYQMKTAA